jgi:hypothetical protein
LHIARTIDNFLAEALSKKVVGYTLYALDAPFRWSPEHYYNYEGVENSKRRHENITKWRIEELYDDHTIEDHQFLDRRKS